MVFGKNVSRMGPSCDYGAGISKEFGISTMQRRGWVLEISSTKRRKTVAHRILALLATVSFINKRDTYLNIRHIVLVSLNLSHAKKGNIENRSKVYFYTNTWSYSIAKKQEFDQFWTNSGSFLEISVPTIRISLFHFQKKKRQNVVCRQK